MSTIATLPSSVPGPGSAPKFDNGEKFLHSLGDVPMSRVIWNPVPGTATEQDQIYFVENRKRFCELIDGTLVEKPIGSPESLLGGWLLTYINLYLETNPIGFTLGADGMSRLVSGRVRMPDVSFISYERFAGHQMTPVLDLGPDLAVEVLSETNTIAEMRQKRIEYFASGARLSWAVNPPQRTVDVFHGPTDQPAFTRDHNGVLDGGDVLPGFTLELSKLFSKLPKP